MQSTVPRTATESWSYLLNNFGPVGREEGGDLVLRFEPSTDYNRGESQSLEAVELAR